MKVKVLNEEQVAFVYASIKERQAALHLQDFYKPIKITHTSDINKYESWDVVLESGTTKQKFVTELKVREKFSDYSWFQSEGIIFEKIKYDSLKKATSTTKGKENNVKPLFIVFLFDCVLVWQTQYIKETDFISKEYRKASVNGFTTKTLKDVTYLQVKDAQRIDFQLDYDNLNIEAKTIFKYEYPNNTIIKNNHHE